MSGSDRPRPAVLFVVGAGRSGSTLLEVELARRFSNVVGVGEQRHVWARGFGQNHLCSCGAPFLSCPFWSQVRHQAFPAAGEPASTFVGQLTQSVDRTRYVPRMTSSRLRWGRKPEVANVARVLSGWYEAISDASNGGLIVDTSKDPSYAFLLATQVDARVLFLHLVRNPAAVSFSWSRAKPRPEIHWQSAKMTTQSTLRSTLEWDVRFAAARWLARLRSVDFIELSYDSFVADPDATFAALSHAVERHLSVSLTPGSGRSHSASGNPIRFDRGPAVIRPDDEWRRAMPLRRRILASAVSAPFRLSYLRIARQASRWTRWITTSLVDAPAQTQRDSDAPAAEASDSTAPRGVSWQGVATRSAITVVARGSMLIGSALVVRLVGRAASGSYFLLLSAMTVCGTVVAFGLPDAISRAYGSRVGATEPAELRQALRSALALIGSVGTTVIAVVALVCALVDPGTLLTVTAPLGMGVLLATEAVAAAWLRASGRGPIAEVLAGIGAVGFMLITATARGAAISSANSAVAWRIGTECFGLLASLLVLAPVLKPARGPIGVSLRTLRPTALPMWLTSVSWLVLQQSDVIFLGLFAGSATVGGYAPILKTADLAAIPIGIVGLYALPVSAQFSRAHHVENLRAVYASSARVVLVLTAPVLVMLFVTPSALVGFLFGGTLNGDGLLVARVLAAAYTINAVVGLNGVTFEAVGRPRTLATRSASALLVGLLANAALIPTYGALGAAFGTLIGYTYLNCVNSALLYVRHGISPWTATLVTPTIAAIAAGVALVPLRATIDGHRLAVPAVGVMILLLVVTATVAAERVTGRAVGQMFKAPAGAVDGPS